MKNWFLIFMLGLALTAISCESEEEVIEEEPQNTEYEDMREDVLKEANEMNMDTTMEDTLRMDADTIE